MRYTCEISDRYQVDVLVVGGGPAGFGAAVAAAQNGAKTLLIEQNGVLGGMATSGLVGPFMTCYDNDVTGQVVKGIFDELCLRTEAQGGAIHPSKIWGMCSYNSYYLGSHLCQMLYRLHRRCRSGGAGRCPRLDRRQGDRRQLAHLPVL